MRLCQIIIGGGEKRGISWHNDHSEERWRREKNDARFFLFSWISPGAGCDIIDLVHQLM
jgi:hypothetical protein